MEVQSNIDNVFADMFVDYANRHVSSSEYPKQFIITLSPFSGEVVDQNGEPVSDQDLKEILRKITPRKYSYIYLAKDPRKRDVYKIGVSKSPRRRTRDLGLELIHEVKCLKQSVYRSETTMHRYFIERNQWLGGERFRLNLWDVQKITSLSEFGSYADTVKEFPLLFGHSWNYRYTKRHLRWMNESAVQRGYSSVYDYHKRISYGDWFKRHCKFAAAPDTQATA